MKELLRTSTNDGKYTLIQYENGRVDVLRHNEPWRENVFDNALLAFAYDLESARNHPGWRPPLPPDNK